MATEREREEIAGHLGRMQAAEAEATWPEELPNYSAIPNPVERLIDIGLTVLTVLVLGIFAYVFFPGR